MNTTNNTSVTADMMKKGFCMIDQRGTEWTVKSEKPYGWEVRGWSADGRMIGEKVIFQNELHFCTPA